jgi:hypothetical protein
MNAFERTETAAGACCGGPAPSGVDACCVKDADAKAAGAAGCGCGNTASPGRSQEPDRAAPAETGTPRLKALRITWKRLVKEGETCPRCGSTGQNLVSAVAKLATVLRPLRIQPLLDTLVIDNAAFRADPAESNRIWIDGKPMEEWLRASVGKCSCCTVCGDLPCRTMEVGGSTYETIPEDLIVRAAMLAASAMIEPAASPGTSMRGAKSCACK